MAVPELTFLWFGSVALLSSAAAISRRFNEVLAGMFGVICWLVWAFQATAVEAQNATTYTLTPQSYVGFAAAFIMLLFTFQAATGRLAPAERTRFGAQE